MTTNYYVYLHKKADTGEIFYVGKGKDSEELRLKKSEAAKLAWSKRDKFTHSEETKRQMSARIRPKHTQSAKNKMSEALIASWKQRKGKEC